MNKIEKNMSNQAVGLLPLLLFMFLDNYFPYLISFFIGVAFLVVSLILFRVLSKDRIYQFMLLPASATLALYTIFILLHIEPVLFDYTPLITEVLLVVVLAIISLAKRRILHNIRHSKQPNYKRTLMRTTVNEFFFLVQLVQGLYTLHLFVVLIYTTLPDTMQSEGMSRFLYRELGVIIGVAIIAYEQIRLSLMRGSLKKEMWLPVLDDSGKVIGCIARSVARSLPKKYYHPIVRIAVVYEGMLYMVKRSKEEYVSPETIDYPFTKYVLFKHTIENTVKAALGETLQIKGVTPRFLVRYTYEDDKVKHLVSLYAVCLRTPEQFEAFKQRNGKLWTPKQIEENISAEIFSRYFEKEFPYLQNTILYAENICCEDAQNKEDQTVKTA